MVNKTLKVGDYVWCIASNNIYQIANISTVIIKRIDTSDTRYDAYAENGSSVTFYDGHINDVIKVDNFLSDMWKKYIINMDKNDY